MDFKAIYTTIQRLTPGTELAAHEGAKRGDIESYQWLFLDIDTVRPDKSQSNATEAEKQASWEVTKKIMLWLHSEHSFPDPVVADSGNGWHMYYKLDSLPNTESNQRLVTDCLKAIKFQFREYACIAEVDVSTGDPEQLTKAYGTLARKGPHSLERPWRQCKLIAVPDNIEPVRSARLSILSVLAPIDERPKRKTTRSSGLHPDFNIQAFFDHYEIGIEHESSCDGKQLFVTDTCYTADPPHKHTGSVETGFILGDALGWKCFSDECVDKNIGDVLRVLNQDHDRYPGPIWKKASLTNLGGWDVEELSPVRDEKKDEALVAESLSGPETVVVLNSAKLENMPQDAMYGYLGQRAKELQVPIGYGYPSLLAVGGALGCYESGEKQHVRGTLYVALLGPVGQGKSIAMERAMEALQVPENRIDSHVHGSERGFIKYHEDKVGSEPVLLLQDEFLTMMQKCGIDHSGLAPTLCQLWSRDKASASDKRGEESCSVRLSLLGNLACNDGAEFAEIFAKGTNKGLADRFVFGLGEPVRYRPVAIERQLIHPSTCKIPGWCYDRVHEWAGPIIERRRLGENILRVTLISACMNRDFEITDAGFTAALRFVEWQEQLRGRYQPSMALDLDGRCSEDVLMALHEIPEGRQVQWSALARKKNFYRKYPLKVIRVRNELIKGGLICYDEDSGFIWLNRPNNKQ